MSCALQDVTCDTGGTFSRYQLFLFFGKTSVGCICQNLHLCCQLSMQIDEQNLVFIWAKDHEVTSDVGHSDRVDPWLSLIGPRG